MTTGARILNALNLFAKLNLINSYVISVALGNLVRLYQATNDDTLPAAVAKVLGISVEDVLKRFEQALVPALSTNLGVKRIVK